MRGSWTRTIKTAADPAELTDVASWLVPRLVMLPSDALAWMLADGPEPWWVGLPQIGELDGLPAIDLDADAVRRWRDEIRSRVEPNEPHDNWIETAMLGGSPVSIQVHSTEAAGRWSGFTLASFAPSPDGSTDGSAVDDPWWIRFEPEGPAPVAEWLIVASWGWSARIVGVEDDAVRIELASREMDGQTVRRGDAVVGANVDRIDAALADVLLDHGRIKRLGLSFQPRSSSRAHVAVEGSARLGPFWLDLLSPAWPLIRPFVSRRIGREATELLDEGQASELWRALVSTARAAKR